MERLKNRWEIVRVIAAAGDVELQTHTVAPDERSVQRLRPQPREHTSSRAIPSIDGIAEPERI